MNLYNNINMFYYILEPNILFMYNHCEIIRCCIPVSDNFSGNTVLQLLVNYLFVSLRHWQLHGATSVTQCDTSSNVT